MACECGGEVMGHPQTTQYGPNIVRGARGAIKFRKKCKKMTFLWILRWKFDFSTHIEGRYCKYASKAFNSAHKPWSIVRSLWGAIFEHFNGLKSQNKAPYDLKIMIFDLIFGREWELKIRIIEFSKSHSSSCLMMGN